MGYAEAMESAGAVVLAYQSFGDWQGSWYAKVQVGTEKFFVAGCYGSCSGCDAFEGEFGYTSHEHGDEYVSVYDSESLTPETCDECASLQKRLVAFGQKYLDDRRTWESLWREQEKDSSWDSEAKHVMAWLEKVKDL